MPLDLASGAPRLNCVGAHDAVNSPLAPSTPQDFLVEDSSQITLPSTEVPASPIEPSQSFSTQANDDDILGPGTTVIPSSLTPPPSTQIEPPNLNIRRTSLLSHSQQSLVSPPATIGQFTRDRETSSDYLAPEPQEVLDASTDELRSMLQSCILEQQKLKTEAAHHRLQYNLLKLQSDDDRKRAEVEYDMLRREIEALRTAEYTRQAKRELSTFSEEIHGKYMDMKSMFDGARDEVDVLTRRLKVATKIIQQKDDELMGALDERDQLLTRIRENREHMHKLCSPGGIFHSALSPRQPSVTSPAQSRGTPRQVLRGIASESGHGLSTLLEVISQDNNSAPSTPIVNNRLASRQTQKHQRNAQSMSSLPTTPINRPRGHGLLPSANLVPMTEPPKSYISRFPEPATPNAKSERRKSRESTISVEADDNEEIARQALKSVQDAARRSFESLTSRGDDPRITRDDDDSELYGSQASQAATEMLRRDARQRFEGGSSSGSQHDPNARETSPAMKPAVLLANLRGGGRGDKRKFSGQNESGVGSKPEQGTAPKKIRTDERLGLGIQYDQ